MELHFKADYGHKIKFIPIKPYPNIGPTQTNVLLYPTATPHMSTVLLNVLSC